MDIEVTEDTATQDGDAVQTEVSSQASVTFGLIRIGIALLCQYAQRYIAQVRTS